MGAPRDQGNLHLPVYCVDCLFILSVSYKLYSFCTDYILSVAAFPTIAKYHHNLQAHYLNDTSSANAGPVL
jgi:hypothetical protein